MKFLGVIATGLLLSGASHTTATSPLAALNNNEIASLQKGEVKKVTAAKSDTISSDMLRRFLLSLTDIDSSEELKEICELTDERLQELRTLQAWLIEYEFDGEVPKFKSFKEKAVWVIFLLAGKDPDTEDLSTTDFELIASLSGISGLTFNELIKCLGNNQGLSHDEILYIFCLGDPHFSTWQGVHFDYHGQCDLVMIQNENFMGQNLDVHVRLEQLMPEGAYSYVSEAAVKIGSDVLEVSNKGVHIFNGQKDAELTTVGGFPVTRSVRKNCVQNAENGEKALGCKQMLTYDIDFGGDDHLQFKVAKDMVHIEVKGRPHKFEGSVGVMGTYPHVSHGRVARDRMTVIQNVDAFAQEWQVIPSQDGTLFDKAAFPQYPQQCTPPSTAHSTAGRALRASPLEERRLSEQAHEVCDHLDVTGNMHKNCIFDVMATGDVELGAIVYGSHSFQ